MPVFLAHQPLAVLLGCDFLNTLLTRDVLQPQALVSAEISWSNDVLIVDLSVKVGSLHHRPDPEASVAAHIPW